MSIYVLGDLHGGADGSMKYLNSRNWKEQKELTKDDTLILLGDFGFFWYPEEHKGYKEDKYYLEWFASRNYTLLVVPGNHENWDIIESLPIIDKWGGKVRVKETSEGLVYIAMIGEVYTIDNKKILTVPGATSSDKEGRVHGQSWWKQEVPNYQQFNYAIDNISKYDYIDIILSHTMPSSMIEYFIHCTPQTEIRFKCQVAEFLNILWNEVDFDEWYCGHFHMNQSPASKT